MGTPWRGLLAPVNLPTGDGRRMAEGAFRWREPPLGLKWQRTDDVGHDNSVIIGSTEVLRIGTVEQAINGGWISAEAVADRLAPTDVGVWAGGELFDDADPAVMPRLAQDVAEAMLLTQKQVIGPSVDGGAVTMIFVETGSDEPITGDRWAELMEETEETGVDPQIEMLFTDYEIAAATLVAIPAFAEARPFELLTPTATGDEPADTTEVAPADAALMVSLTAAAAVLPAEVFVPPLAAPDYQLITVHPARPGETFRRVDGYVAAFGTCHLQYRPVCVTPPQSTTGYAMFHRTVIDTSDGPLDVGRITTGHGRVGTGCAHAECRGKDDHACDLMTLAETLAHYDRLRAVATVRAHEYPDMGVWVCGVLAADADERDLRVLSRRRVSGDWREIGSALEMVELLALAKEEAGFPVPHAGMRGGRQISLTAAVPRPRADATSRRNPGTDIDYGRLAREAADRVTRMMPAWLRTHAGQVTVTMSGNPGLTINPPTTTTSAVTAAEGHTGAMVAFVMSTQDATRLAVEGGEPAEELHATRAYLGEGADWSDEDRSALIDAMRPVAEGMQPFDAEAFHLAFFNPGTDTSCVVLGLAGDEIADAHDTVMGALEPFADKMPEQHRPHVEHVTLQYTPDAGRVAELTDRASAPVRIDTLRVAFAGVVTDLPLGGTPETPADEAARLAGEVEAAIAGVDADARARTSAQLLRELEAVNV